MLRLAVVRRSKKLLSAKPVVVGTGLVALDVVIADDVKTDPILCVGGTCGNVLTALAYLGWDAYPIARLRSDAASKRIVEDLKSWKVKLDFVSLSESGSTPIVVQRIREKRNGERSHSFSRKCPNCGSWLPWYKAVRVATALDLKPHLPKADVFYFDRTSRGAVTLAQNARKNGMIVVFEPSSESDPKLLTEALEAAHIVKVASDRVNGNEALLNSTTPLLLIETLGAAGLRYSHTHIGRRRVWKTLPAFRLTKFRDSAGAGDWCTAGIIDAFGTNGPDGLAKASPDHIHSALARGQAMAAWTCQYDGARGGMYSSSRREFDQEITGILNGKLQSQEKHRVERLIRTPSDTVWCHWCLTGG
jgi:sugar/nucleoside kinase (ribokinase family)